MNYDHWKDENWRTAVKTIAFRMKREKWNASDHQHTLQHFWNRNSLQYFKYIEVIKPNCVCWLCINELIALDKSCNIFFFNYEMAIIIIVAVVLFWHFIGMVFWSCTQFDFFFLLFVRSLPLLNIHRTNEAF